MAEVDVVVVAYNSRPTLRACVEPLARESWIETIVVDNASPDRSAEAVADLPVMIVREGVNRGFAAGCNAGWRRGSSPFVLFLNPDAVISPETLRRLAATLEGDDGIGGVGPRIVDADGALDYSIRRFPRLR